MKPNITFKGTRWYKCDLHLHTTASDCFKDKEVTEEQWVNKAIKQGLDCVAVTDHNSSLGIEAIQKAAKGTSLTVFPGVELTCDTSKIHLLVLFDVNKTSSDVRDFLVKTDIKRNDFGKQDTYTNKQIFQIVELAKNDGALVIPAHIDEYSGLGSVSVNNIKDLYQNHINAVQIIHKDFLNNSLKISNNESLKKQINEFHGNPNPQIDYTTIKQWYNPVKYAIDNNLALLTFSDNPHEPNNPKHGFWGIGKSYSWIKMDEKPSLEGLRQAFLLPEFRVRNMFESPNKPYVFPEIWIKSITIKDTLITEKDTPLTFEFSPQLNTIIGGRGSGKSSILRFIRGVLNKIVDIKQLEDILKDHNEFYKKTDNKNKGVLNENSVIEVEIVRNDTLHKVIATNITNSKNQRVEIHKWNEEKKDWDIVENEGYINFFEFDIYSQKQIYEIAQDPNALRERIDNSIKEIETLINKRQIIKNSFLEKSTSIRTKDQIITEEGVTETKLKDKKENIEKLQKSGIASLLNKKEKFAKEQTELNSLKEQIENKENLLLKLIQSFNIEDIKYNSFEDNHKQVLKPITNKVSEKISEIKNKLEQLRIEIEEVKSQYVEELKNSLWKIDFSKNLTEFETKKTELEQDGIKDIENFEKLTEEKKELQSKLERIKQSIEEREKEIIKRKQLQNNFLNTCNKIARKRKEFVDTILKDNRVKINIKPFKDRVDFENKLRNILQKKDWYEKDIDYLIDLCFNGNVELKIKEFKEIILKIRKDEDISKYDISGHFTNLIKGLNDAQIDEIELFLPEDEIEVQYRTSNKSPFKSLSTASAGQKTTAILTFILSYGNAPLILDQPEDDLDNKLVYDLIVDRLKQAKDSRQLIIVTHNANIPVNGDAEYIISMDTESKKLKIIAEGTVEQIKIKNEIRNVMEGGEQAFEMRAKRYKQR